jgi:hypothetical protein
MFPLRRGPPIRRGFSSGERGEAEVADARVGERLPGHARTGRASLNAALCSELVEQSHAGAGGQTQRRDCELFRLLCRRVERRKQRKEHAETTSHRGVSTAETS